MGLRNVNNPRIHMEATMMKAVVTVSLTCNDLKTLNKQIEQISLMFIGLKIVTVAIYEGQEHAEHPRDAGKAPDAKEPDLPSGTVRSPWSGDPGPI